jgi:hypothetical protein
LFSIRGACCLALVATFCCLIDLPVLAQETSGVSLPRKTETSIAAQSPEEEALVQSKVTQEARRRD